MFYWIFKVVKISDRCLVYVYKMFMVMIFVYVFVLVIGVYTYMFKEKLRVYMFIIFNDIVRDLNFVDSVMFN